MTNKLKVEPTMCLAKYKYKNIYLELKSGADYDGELKGVDSAGILVKCGAMMFFPYSNIEFINLGYGRDEDENKA